jgi:hypothetical protein
MGNGRYRTTIRGHNNVACLTCIGPIGLGWLGSGVSSNTRPGLIFVPDGRQARKRGDARSLPRDPRAGPEREPDAPLRIAPNVQAPC